MIINKRITSICFSLIIAIAMIIPCFAEASYKGSGLDKGVTFILPNQWEEVAEEDKQLKFDKEYRNTEIDAYLAYSCFDDYAESSKKIDRKDFNNDHFDIEDIAASENMDADDFTKIIINDVTYFYADTQQASNPNIQMYYARRIDNGVSYVFILLTKKGNNFQSEFKSILKSVSYPVVETKSEGSVDEGDTGDDTALFLFAFLVTFAVVLLPPILYRKYKTTEPLEKKPAIIFSVVYFIVWAIVFEALGPENKFSVGILWTFFVYAVLRSPKINSKIKQIPDEIVMSTDLSDADEKDEPNMSEDVDSSFVADEKDEPNMSEDINSSFDDSMDYSSCETGQNVDGITLFVDENTESDNQE